MPTYFTEEEWQLLCTLDWSLIISQKIVSCLCNENLSNETFMQIQLLPYTAGSCYDRWLCTWVCVQNTGSSLTTLKQWIKESFAIFICKEKSASEQDVLTMMKTLLFGCATNQIHTFQVGYFSIRLWVVVVNRISLTGLLVKSFQKPASVYARGGGANHNDFCVVNHPPGHTKAIVQSPPL